MDKKIVSFSLRYRFLVVVAFMAILILGVYKYYHLPVDAFPDISPIMVPVFVEAHGMAPEEVERLITFPIESRMTGLPRVTGIKSTSAFGMAVIYVYFEDGVDIYFARQIVSERLASAAADLPDLHEAPKLGPISTGLGQIFIYYLALDEGADTHGREPGSYLREINDWIVKYQLQTVPGVTDILSIGGHVLEYQVRVDPYAMAKHHISLETVVDAIRANNRNAGGQFIVTGSEEYLVRGIGLVQGLGDIENIHLRTTDGTAVRIRDVAEVSFGSEIRRGVVSRNGAGEVVSGMVLQLFGENTSAVIKRLYEKIPEVQASLPDGVRLVPYYEQAELVKEATGTVKRALIMGAALVLLTLAVFLGNFRTALVVALALPISALVSVICMSYAGISANVMSLGGIAIAIGMLGDGTIVMVENIYRKLGAVSGDGEYCRAETIMSAAQEVSRPVIFSIMIIITVFLPVFTLQNVEGKMFSPMAFTLTFALLGSMMMAVAAAPALCTWLLKGGAREEPAALRRMKNAYKPALGWVVRRKKAVVIAAVAAFAASMAAVPFIGTEFMPALEEGSILIGVTMAPSISLEEATAVVQKMERRIAGHEEVSEVISRIGRPEAGTHPHPVNYAEVHVSLKPRKEWRRFDDKQELIASLSGELASFPGVKLNFTQPIQNAFDELLSGTKAQIAIKLFGEDLDLLRDTAGEISAAIEGVDGLVDLYVEQSFGQPQIQVVADREACARYGVDAGSIMDLVELAVGGEAVDYIYLGTRRHPINVRYREEYRNSPEALAGLLMETESGALIPLSQVAAVRQVIGPVQVSREHNQRRWAILGNVRGRDMGSVMKDVRSIIGEKIELPPGMYVEYGGQFENQQRAMKRLMIIVPITMALVFFFLGIAFGSVRKALLIILTIPLALFGGVLGLLATGEYLSVPAAIGFIALFGISVQNSMVLVSCVSRLRSEGRGLEEAVVEGALLRLRPVLLTAATTVLGLLPLLVSRGAGSEVQRPLSVVVVFGLLSATLFTLFVVPAAYGWFEDRVVEPAACEPRNG